MFTITITHAAAFYMLAGANCLLLATWLVIKLLFKLNAPERHIRALLDADARRVAVKDFRSRADLPQYTDGGLVGGNKEGGAA